MWLFGHTMNQLHLFFFFNTIILYVLYQYQVFFSYLYVVGHMTPSKHILRRRSSCTVSMELSWSIRLFPRVQAKTAQMRPATPRSPLELVVLIVVASSSLQSSRLLGIFSSARLLQAMRMDYSTNSSSRPTTVLFLFLSFCLQFWVYPSKPPPTSCKQAALLRRVGSDLKTLEQRKCLGSPCLLCIFQRACFPCVCVTPGH